MSSTACGTVPAEPVRVVTPALTPVSAETQRDIADDLERYVPEGSPIWMAIADWIGLRDQIRAALPATGP